MYILYVDETDADFHQNLLTSDAEVHTFNTPQDTKDCSLKYKPFLYYCYLHDFGEKCEWADFFFCFER